MTFNAFLKAGALAGAVLLVLNQPALAAFGITGEEANVGYGKGMKGAVNDNLFYSIGGGTVISQPPSSNNMEKMGLGISWNNDLMCGNFDLSTTVKNQLNGATDGFKNMMGDVINGATGAVASLPAMIIQRANPGLYELLTNGVLQANVAFDKAQLNCQTMSKKLADYSLSGKLTQTAIGEEFQNVISSTSDAIRADNSLKKSTGKEGVKWVGGQQRGGTGQKAIKPTYDIAKAGYNILNKQSATSDAAVSTSACNGSLCQKYKTSAEAADAVSKVLGDRALRTCVSGSECNSGGLENEPGTSTPGEGFSPMLEKTTKENQEILIKLVNGNLAPNATNLGSLKTGDLAVTRGVNQPNEVNIEAKKNNVLRDISLNKGETFTVKEVKVMPESLPAALASIIADEVNPLERSLIVDLGGTTLDCGMIQGAFESITEVKGNAEIGTSRINRAVMNALMNASTPSSYYVTGEIIRNHLDEDYLRTLINDVDQISNIQSVIQMESASLADGVRNEIESFSGMHRIYLTGGGAEIIYPYIKGYFPRHKVSKVEEPQFALVKAMVRA